MDSLFHKQSFQALAVVIYFIEVIHSYTYKET